MEELVVLVDEENNEIGTAEKSAVHTKNTPLHRGFSLFLFNGKGELLLTKRSSRKKTFPGVWTNTVCGHPGPGESAVDAAKRRLKEELGISLKRSHLVRKQGEALIREVAPYRYRFADRNGIVENEICPILVGYLKPFITDTLPPGDYVISPDPNEVDDWRWMRWEEFLEEIKKNPEMYSPWSREESLIVVPLR